MMMVAFLYAIPLLTLAFITGDTRISPDKETPDMRNVCYEPIHTRMTVHTSIPVRTLHMHTPNTMYIHIYVQTHIHRYYV